MLFFFKKKIERGRNLQMQSFSCYSFCQVLYRIILVQGKVPEYTGTRKCGIPLLVSLFIADPMYSMLICFIIFRGAEPKQLAFSTAVGTALGVFPIFGIFLIIFNISLILIYISIAPKF
jgi:hypothetical protein